MGVSSTINKYKVECVEEKQTWLNATWYSQSKGKGKILGEDTTTEIGYPKPNTSGYEVMKFVCDNAK